MTELFTNQVFSGGLALGALGSIVLYARRYLLLLFVSLRRRFVTDFEVREAGMVMHLGLWLAHTSW